MEIINILNNTNPLTVNSITRLEVIDENGRTYVNNSIQDLHLSIQDNDKTLKIFLKNNYSRCRFPI